MSQTFESFGKYVLLEKLAMGGMAEVYLAKNQGTDGIGKLVAIKRILPQFSEQTEFIEMFKDEAKIAVNLAHSNIVSIHEFGVERSQFFLVMDYIEGRNLRQILNKMKKSGLSFSIEQVLYIVKEVAAGLDHAHRCLDATTGKPLNITHRDMSPQNVMVSFEGEVKVVDFGIAKAETQIETTRAGTLKGKFGYMSPEQAEGQVVDLRTDIFSLGIVLWELLANDRLFVANNEINTLRKIRDCQVPSLRKINPNIPQELERICNKALARDRNLRYQTAAAFHRELNRFLNRQYPDFSPHDFSVFIKTLFASEILENRKKIVDYSKADFSNLARNQTQSVTPAPQVQTLQARSEAMTDQLPPVQPLANRPILEPLNPNGKQLAEIEVDEDDEKETGTEHTVNTDGAYFTNQAHRNAAAKTEPLPPFGPQPKGYAGIQPAKDVSQSKAKTTTKANGETNGDQKLRVDPLSRPPMGSSESPLGVRDGSFASQSIPSYRQKSGYTQTGIHIQTPNVLLQRVQKGAIYFGVALAMIFVLWFAIDRESFVHLVHNVLRPGRTTQPSPQEEPGFSNQASVTALRVPITSNPPSAEIWIDGKMVKDVTPTLVDLERDKDYVIVIKKPDHIEWRSRMRFSQSGERLSVNLQRSRIGFVDVIVEGAGEIFVNNQQVARAGPVLNHPIPADEPILVRAFDKNTGAVDEQTIRVGEGHSWRVVLRPRVLVQIPPSPQKLGTPPQSLPPRGTIPKGPASKPRDR